MYQLEEAIAKLKDAIREKIKIIELPIRKARGHILATDIFAPISVPMFPKSAMDGYAIRSSELVEASMDNPITLSVIGELCAGEYKEFNPTRMDTIRIMTGSFVPKEYDAIVKQEDTDYGEFNVNVYAKVEHLQNYCQVGEDIKKGELIIREHTMLKSLHIGLLASLGIKSVNVIEPLKIGIISTGTELKNPGETLEKAQIYNSISYILTAKIEAYGHKVIAVKNCMDEINTLIRTIKEVAAEADFIITTGGVSVGKKDLIPEFILKTGADYIVKGIEIQPGTPTCASSYENKIILHLSGNPYAALTHFEMLFWPVVSKFMSNNLYEIKSKTAVLKCEFKKNNKMRRIVRAFEENGEVTLPTVIHSSSVISNLMECNCFIDMKAGEKYEIGDIVTVWNIKDY